MPEGVDFPFPSLLFYEGRTYGQPEVVLISLPQVATGICWNQVVCKGMAGKQRLCLKIKKLSETQRSK